MSNPRSFLDAGEADILNDNPKPGKDRDGVDAKGEKLLRDPSGKSPAEYCNESNENKLFKSGSEDDRGILKD